jgi:hypothetical protein
MLTQLLEHLMASLIRLGEEHERIAIAGNRLPAEYWAGSGMILTFTADDIEEVLQATPDGTPVDTASLEEILGLWSDCIVDLHQDMKDQLRNKDRAEAIFVHGQIYGFAHAYWELRDIVEYVKAVGDTRS